MTDQINYEASHQIATSLDKVENAMNELRILVARMDENGKPPHPTMIRYIEERAEALHKTINNFQSKYRNR